MGLTVAGAATVAKDLLVDGAHLGGLGLRRSFESLGDVEGWFGRLERVEEVWNGLERVGEGLGWEKDALWLVRKEMIGMGEEGSFIG